jgi:arylsulfatase A
MIRSLLLALSLPFAARAADLPNVVVIFCDDLGYADIGPFGAQGYDTPHLDKLAAQGTRFTNFHVAQAVCSASRAALMTGCYPNRIGIHGALSPRAQHGLANSEVTLAEICKQKGYATAAVGKWHLGSKPQFFPTTQGFDSYLGLPYSNDMWPRHPEAKAGTYPELPLIQNTEVIDEDVSPEDQEQLTTRYTEAAVDFIQKSKGRPFFLYLAHSMPHVPLYVSSKFKGKSKRGVFGDVIMEIDWSVGQVMKALDGAGVAENTWVIFTSDNGPWLSYGEHAGSAGPLREGKGSSWEGGVRVPCIMRWPGQIPAAATSEQVLMTIDVLPTLAARLGAKLPDHPIDGKDVWPILTGSDDAESPHEHYFVWYENNQLQAVISADGQWKLQLPHKYRSSVAMPRASGGIPSSYQQASIDKAELYHLSQEIAEANDVAKDYPEVVKTLQAAAEKARAKLGDSLMKRAGAVGEVRMSNAE